MQMDISEIMRTVLTTVSMDHTLGQAQEIMIIKKIRHLLVMDGSDLVGVITDRDVRSHVSHRIDTQTESKSDHETLEVKVHQTMTRELITASPDTSVAEAAKLIVDNKIGCLPIINKDGSTAGIITDFDFLMYIAREAKKENA
jgi:acetoin utilization protein AcuB